jgi:hypothetical protein
MSEPDQPILTEETLRDEMSTIFDGSRSNELNGKFEKIYDDAQTVAEREEKQAMPSRPGEDIGQTMERAYEWGSLTKSEQRRQATEGVDDETRRTEARQRGLTVQELEAVRQTEAIERQTKEAAKVSEALNEYSPAAEAIGKLYPGQKTGEIARGYADLDMRLRANPLAGFQEIAQRLGFDPRQVGYALLQNQSEQLADQESISLVEQFLRANPEADKYRFELAGELMRSGIEESEDWQRDLKTIFNKVRKRFGGKAPRKDIQAEMSEIYDRVASR